MTWQLIHPEDLPLEVWEQLGLVGQPSPVSDEVVRGIRVGDCVGVIYAESTTLTTGSDVVKQFYRVTVVNDDSVAGVAVDVQHTVERLPVAAIVAVVPATAPLGGGSQ